MLSIVGASLSYFVLYTAHLQCYFLQCNCLQCSLARAYSIHTQECMLPYTLGLPELSKSPRVAKACRSSFLVAAECQSRFSHSAPSSWQHSWDVTDVPCMLSPSDRQLPARVCTPTLSTQQNPCAKCCPSFWSRFLKLRESILEASSPSMSSIGVNCQCARALRVIDWIGVFSGTLRRQTLHAAR